jgi:hypothetical protein
MFLPKISIPVRKKGTSSPTTLEKYALKLPDRYVKKNPCSTPVYYQAGGSKGSGGG